MVIHKLVQIMQKKNPRKAGERRERYPFVAEHRGGPLIKDDHRKLMKWARECSDHVIFLIGTDVDDRLIYALDVAKKWEKGMIPTGVAIKASLGAHAVAREAENPVHKAVARSVGHALATAHMADHSPGAAFYALKAIKLANRDTEKEKKWQDRKLNELPSELKEIIEDIWKRKKMDSKL